MHKLFQMALFTIRDQLRHKSFYVLLGGSTLLLFLIRGCYTADFHVNGKAIDASAFVGYISIISFQIVCYTMFLLAILLSMKILTRDKNDGAMVMFLSRPMSRWQYIFGRITGTWFISTAFMLVLHAILLGITWSQTGNILIGLLPASLLSAVNLLCIIIMVCLFSLFMPDFMAALTSFGIITIGLFSEAGFQIVQGKLFQAISQGNVPPGASLWRVFYPKVSMLQYYAGTIINQSDFQGMGLVHPIINVLVYLLIAGILLLLIFGRKEV